MYNSGDDIGAVVGDVGSAVTKIGFAGEDTPRALFSSGVGITVDHASDIAGDAMDVADESVEVHKYYVDAASERTDIELRWPSNPIQLQDMDLLENIWEYAASNKLNTPLSDTPVLAIGKSNSTGIGRHQYTELMYEKFGVPALFMARDAVMSCYSIGKTTGTVVDIGEHTTVSAVTDGWVDQDTIYTSPIGGGLLLQYCNCLLNKSLKRELKPIAAIKKGFPSEDTWHPSYRSFAQSELMRDILEHCCHVSDIPIDETLPQFANAPGVPYTLPDGTEVMIGNDRFRVTELLFDPDVLLKTKGTSPLAQLSETLQTEIQQQQQQHTQYSVNPLHSIVYECISNSERDVQFQLANNIVLCGGSSIYDGLAERLKNDIESITHTAAPSWKIKVLAAAASERKIASWLGGSILGSLGSFHEMYMSKAEYDEHGAAYIDKKCP